MNITTPDTARARDDLPWLRRRTTRAAAPELIVGPAAGEVVDFLNARGARPSQCTGLAVARTPSLPDLPQPGCDLDLSGDFHRPTTPSAQAGRPDRTHPSCSRYLDLSRQVPRPSAIQAGADPTSNRPDDADRSLPARTRQGRPTILTTKRPLVTLTRVQSGVGVLTFQAACSDSVGDLRLGCAYQFVSGQSSVIHASGLRVAPAGSRRPVIIASGERFEALTVDLAQSREVERLVVYAYSASGATLNWDGTLVVQTYGGARIEVPLQRDPAAGVLVPLSLYNINGQFVLRAEQSIIGGSIREATAAFGFERISWLDDQTPLV